MARLVLDASVLIAMIDRSDKHHAWAFDLFRQTTDHALILSALTLTEVMVRPMRNGREDQMRTAIESLRIEKVAFDSADCEPVAYIRASTSMKLPDAVVLHTAQVSNSSLATMDKALAKNAREFGLTVYSPSFRE